MLLEKPARKSMIKEKNPQAYRIKIIPTDIPVSASHARACVHTLAHSLIKWGHEHHLPGGLTRGTQAGLR